MVRYICEVKGLAYPNGTDWSRAKETDSRVIAGERFPGRDSAVNRFIGKSKANYQAAIT